MNPEIEVLHFENGYSPLATAQYRSYLRSLERVFDLSALDSFCHAGCLNGGLLSALRQRYPRISLKGIYSSNQNMRHTDYSVSFDIEIADLSIPYNGVQQYDMVSCNGIDEYLSPEEKSIYIDNLLLISKDILVLGWGEDKLEESSQHLNPLTKKHFRGQMVARGFDLWPEVTEDLRNFLQLEVKYGAHEWRVKQITVYRRRRYLDMHPKRFVQGTATDGEAPNLNCSYHGQSLQRQVLTLRDQILMSVSKREPLSILRFGDGDFYFANAIPNGSAQPGIRALRIKYQFKQNLKDCRLGLFRADYVATEIGSMVEGGLRLMLLLELVYRIVPKFHSDILWRNSLFPRVINRLLQLVAKAFRGFSVRLLLFPFLAYLRQRLRLTPAQFPILRPLPFSVEAVYSLVASRILFRMFPSEILLVGQTQKLVAIQELVKHKHYRQYLGVNNFCGYVGVEKIGAADDEEVILKDLQAECKKTNPKLILIGIGSAKLYVLARIRSFSDATVIDIGAGLDALAGVISQDRPYFADWTNFKSNSIQYSAMDLLDASNPARDADKYRKINIELPFKS